MARRPMSIIGTNAGPGVILSRTDSPYEEYRVQLIEVTEDGYGGLKYEAGWQGLYSANEICGLGFCENDSEQAIILCAAAGIAFHSGRKYSEDVG